jgi:hypothetical protein
MPAWHCSPGLGWPTWPELRSDAGSTRRVYAKVWIEELSAPELKASDSSQIGSYFSTLPGEQRRNLMLLIICLERPWFCHVVRGPPRFYACY